MVSGVRRPTLRAATREDLIRAIIKVKFPVYQSTIASSKSPSESKEKKVEKLRSDLELKSLKELERLASDLSREKAAKGKKDRFDELKESEPRHTWNSDEARIVDYDFWVKLDLWTMHEAVWLFLERNPERINAQQSDMLRMCFEHGTAKRYYEIIAIAGRSIAAKKLSEKSTPQVWFEWAKEKKIDIPKGLHDLLATVSEKVIFDTSNNDESEMSVTEKENLLRVIGAIAYTLSLENKGRYSNNGYPNFSRIGDKVSEDMEHLAESNIMKITGLSKNSIRTKISAGLKLLRGK